MRFSFAPGSTPLEGFTIEQGIGIGGFGEVYRAVSSIGKRVALKKIQRNLAIELRGVKQCINLKHVNLISLWDIRTDVHGESWVVMEYVPGPSLRDVVHAYPNGLPEDEVKRWFVSTASGVAYLHQQDIVHRDLKPGNIFLDEETQVIKIGDYGLSKFMNTSRRSGQTESVGTFHYMAPEIGRGVYGREIDIYALGIILFEILTGDVPFDGESTQEIIMKHLTDDPKLDRVPAGFRKAIRLAMQKDPEMRYHNVPEMLADLPWPDIAENCQKIIVLNAVGPLVSNVSRAATNSPGSQPLHPLEITHDHVSLLERGNGAQNPVGPSTNTNGEGSDSAAYDLIGENEVQIVDLAAGADIVFGPLKDLSQAGSVAPVSSRGSQSSSERIVPNPAAVPDHQTRTTTTTHTAQYTSTNTGNDSVRSESPTPTTNSVPTSLRRLPTVELDYGTASSNRVNGTLLRRVDEPIARVTQRAMETFGHWWTYGNVSTPVKVLLLVVGSLTLVANSVWLLPLAIGLGLVYLIYYVVRTWWLQDRSYGNLKINKRASKKILLDDLRGKLRLRPTSQRVIELLGSMLVAALACGVLSLIGLAVGGSAFNATKELWQAYGWMTATSVLACSLLLLVSKFWEDRHGETIMRRFTMIILGVMVGGFSYMMANAFSVSLMDATQFGSIDGPGSRIVIKGMPVLPAFLLYYAGMFGILRWWMLADPVRSTRLSVLSVSFCLVWACLFSVLLELPIVPNCILAVVISIAIQLAAPWWSLEEAKMAANSKRRV